MLLYHRENVCFWDRPGLGPDHEAPICSVIYNRAGSMALSPTSVADRGRRWQPDNSSNSADLPACPMEIRVYGSRRVLGIQHADASGGSYTIFMIRTTTLTTIR